MKASAAGEQPELLPLHGFVLAGGRSSRMGRDKALLPFQGQPMISFALQTLREVCATTSIAGNRDDLAGFAPVVRERREDAGPGAGIEAALAACSQPWAMFLPVDVPLIPSALLRLWAVEVLRRAESGCCASFLLVDGEKHPACCMLPRAALRDITEALDQGEHRIERLLRAGEAAGHGRVWPVEAGELLSKAIIGASVLRLWFSNVNTPGELAEAVRRAEMEGER